MNQTPSNRAGRRSTRVGRVRKAAWVGTTATAMAVGLAVAPEAQAIDITIDRDFTWDPVYTSGLLASVLNFASNLLPGQQLQLTDDIAYNTGPPANVAVDTRIQSTIPGIPVIGEVNLNLGLVLDAFLKNIDPSTKSLYNTVAAIPLQGNPCGGGGGGNVAPAFASQCRYAVQLATSQAVLNLIDAYRTQIASVKGTTPGDYIPYEAAPGSTAALPTFTSQVLAFLQNPLRPNGGLAARFPDISKALGIDPVMPGPGKTVSPDGKVVVNTSTADVTWAYDPVGDFPAAFSPFSILNSLNAALPLNFLGGLTADPIRTDSDLTTLGLNLATVLQLPLDVFLNIPVIGQVGLKALPMAAGQSFYATLVPNQLPLLAPIRLPGIGINALLSAVKSPYLLGNPFADAIEPALKILVNSGYTDVLAPDELNTCATGCYGATPQSWAQLGYQAYDRTFGAYSVEGDAASPRTPTPFGSVAPLTPEEKRAVPGDVWTALVGGIQAQLAKPFWGILVPNTGTQSAATTPAPVQTSAAVKAAASTPEPAPVAAPVVSAPAPVAVPQPAPVSAPVVSVPAAPVSAAVNDPDPAPVAVPVADPAPAVEMSAPPVPDADPEPEPVRAPRGSSHRGAAGASDNGGNSGNASGAPSKGHRGAA